MKVRVERIVRQGRQKVEVEYVDIRPTRQHASTSTAREPPATTRQRDDEQRSRYKLRLPWRLVSDDR
jgi:hypothetical protein